MISVAERDGDNLGGYDRAQQLAVAVVSDRLATHNPEIARIVKKGLTPAVFKEIQLHITEQDIKYLQSEVLPEFLAKDCESFKDEAELVAPR